MPKNIVFSFLFFSITAHPQDTLPKFSVVHKGNHRAIVSWTHQYSQVKQISIQRSADSTTNFKTLLTVPDPLNRLNGFLDNKVPDGKIYYRLYFLLGGSNFLYTKSLTPTYDSIQKLVTNRNLPTSEAVLVEEKITDTASAEEMIQSKRIKLERIDFQNDSISRSNISTVQNSSRPNLLIPTYRILATVDGLIKIRLPEALQKKYAIKFYEAEKELLFEIKEITDTLLMMEKSNFHHAGWYYYELYENNRMIEKQRFFIPKL